MRDFVNQGEKLKLLNDAKSWMHIRELRNITKHEYTAEDLSQFLITLRDYTPRLIALNNVINL